MRAMVLAAGRGSRLRPLTDVTPKPLVEVGGITLLERAIRRLEAAGFDHIVVNVSWLGEQVMAALKQRQGKARIALSDERSGLLDTGGGVHRVLAQFGDTPFALVNADVLTDYPAAALAARIQHWREGDRAHLVLVPNPAHNTRGDFALADSRLCSGGDLTYSGVSVLHPGLFAGVPDEPVFPLAPLLRAAATANRASGEVHRGYWNDVGTPERLVAAREWIISRPE